MLVAQNSNDKTNFVGLLNITNNSVTYSLIRLHQLLYIWELHDMIKQDRSYFFYVCQCAQDLNMTLLMLPMAASLKNLQQMENLS